MCRLRAAIRGVFLASIMAFQVARMAYLRERIAREDGELVYVLEIVADDDDDDENNDSPGEDLTMTDDEEHNLQKRDYNLDGYIMSCNHTLDIFPDKVIRLISPYNGRRQYPGGLGCEWEVVGSEECFPVVACTVVDLRRSDCSEDALVISDGFLGEKPFCGPNMGFSHPYKPRLGVYMYLTFRTGDSTHFDRLYKGINCHIRCHSSPRVRSTLLQELPRMDPPKEEYSVLCGKKYNEGNSRIVGGTTAERREFPWQAAVVKAGSRKPFCGGTLINSKFILTAAHCVLDDLEDVNTVWKPSSVEILLRAHVLEVNERELEEGESGELVAIIPGAEIEDTPEAREEIRLKVDKIVVHKLYNQFVTHELDIALIRLQSTLDLKDKNTPTPICLPVLTDANSLKRTFEGEVAIVTGWGYGHEMGLGTAKTLQKLDVPVVSWEKCKSLYFPDIIITESMLCAGYVEGGKDACQGDSGGPLIVKQAEHYVQIGIVSFGEGCARRNRPGVFAHVPRLMPWIHHWTKGTLWARSQSS